MKKSNANRWIVLGTGRVGRTLLLLAEQLNIDVGFSWSQSKSIDDLHLANTHKHFVGNLPKDEDFSNAIVFISVVDDAIFDVATTLAEPLNKAICVVHLSGLLTSQVLKDSGIDVPCASMHPVVAVSDPKIALTLLPDVFWSIEGDANALEKGKEVLAKINVEPVVIRPENKPLYHAAAVFSAGQIVSLIDAAILVATEAGLNRSEARRMLLPLAQSALNNLENKTTKEALTGPLSRGDSDVIELHKKALGTLDTKPPLEIYETLNNYMSARLLEDD